MGWAALLNGNLLASAEEHNFEVLVTADKSMQYQQTMTGRQISIILLNGLYIKWEYIEPLAPQIQAVLDGNLSPSSFISISPEPE